MSRATAMNQESAKVGTVKSSKPQLVHVPSKESGSSSERHTTDYASAVSSNKSRNPGEQYDTPPSKTSSPHNKDPAQSAMESPTKPAAIHQAPPNVRFRQAAQAPRPFSMLQGTNGNTSPPTPGVDDTPYIRFALEQLTRDEELLGRGRQGSVTSDEFPIERITPHGGLHDAQPPRRPTGRQQRLAPSQPVVPENRGSPELLLSMDPPTGFLYPDLEFIPTILRPIPLAFLTFICTLMIAALIFCNIFSLNSNGLFDYDGVGTPRYFVFQYLPQFLAILIILWLFIIQAAIYRIIPFLIMSSERPIDRVLQDLSLVPANFVLPDISYFKHGEPVTGVILFVFWLSNFTVPLQSCAFQTEFFNKWRWTSVQGVVWALVVLYTMLAIALVLCAYRFRKNTSALMWDPVSLADLIPLFQRSNVLFDFAQSEISGSTRKHLPPKLLRLGYWTTSKGATIFHGIGEDNAPLRQSSIESEKSTDNFIDEYDQELDVEQQRYSNAESFTRSIHSPFVRYRWTPWFLRDSAIIAWIAIALALVIAFLVVSFVNAAVERGFLPRLPARTNSHGFSAANFLFSFLPSLLGMVLFLIWQPIDTYFRVVQPFARLSHSAGAAAEHSLLLAYPSCYPIEVTLLAIHNGDFKVAWTSFISLISITIPVLSGGVFFALFYGVEQEVRVTAHVAGYLALVVFVVIYALTFLVIWPTRKRYLPHRPYSLADMVSFIYQSPLLKDAAFREPKTKADLVTRLVSALAAASGQTGSPRYSFGIYIGRDGKEHLGIDRMH